MQNANVYKITATPYANTICKPIETIWPHVDGLVCVKNMNNKSWGQTKTIIKTWSAWVSTPIYEVDDFGNTTNAAMEKCLINALWEHLKFKIQADVHY